jgi:uncharacterized protein involved in type VI secretion and phage assembly
MSLADWISGGGGAEAGPPERFYGKYRGRVVSNTDPDKIGRLLVEVPDVQALFPSSWAMPCVPFAGNQTGAYVVPPVGAGVWVEFEQGDPEYPIWVGGFWGGTSEVPNLAQGATPPQQNVVIETQGGTTFMLSDTSGPTGGILLKLSSGASIAINDNGITLSTGQGAKISLTGSSVNINNGALQVQ